MFSVVSTENPKRYQVIKMGCVCSNDMKEMKKELKKLKAEMKEESDRRGPTRVAVILVQ
jgi:Holliday junction resolvasome RuvABC endonuclease subunit